MTLFRQKLQQQQKQDPASQLHCQEEEEAAGDKEEEPQTSAFWRFFEECASGDTAIRNLSEDVMLDVRSNLEEPTFHRSADPPSWWQTSASVHPRLKFVMARRLCIVVTSFPSEKIFSKARQIITKRRNWINPPKLKHLVFLNANLS